MSPSAVAPMFFHAFCLPRTFWCTACYGRASWRRNNHQSRPALTNTSLTAADLRTHLVSPRWAAACMSEAQTQRWQQLKAWTAEENMNLWHRGAASHRHTEFPEICNRFSFIRHWWENETSFFTNECTQQTDQLSLAAVANCSCISDYR